MLAAKWFSCASILSTFDEDKYLCDALGLRFSSASLQVYTGVSMDGTD